MRWCVAIAVILIFAGAGVLAYAMRMPVYTDAEAVRRFLQYDYNPTEQGTRDWYTQMRKYETPEKRRSGLGRGVFAAGCGVLERFLFNLTHAPSRREALHDISSLAGIDLIPALRSKRRAPPRGASISLRQIK